MSSWRWAAGKTSTPFGDGRPFDVELTRLPPGAVNWPFHSHAAQWELFLVLAGQGKARTPEGVVALAAGDCLLFAPGEAHQLTNPGISPSDQKESEVLAVNRYG